MSKENRKNTKLQVGDIFVVDDKWEIIHLPSDPQDPYHVNLRKDFNRASYSGYPIKKELIGKNFIVEEAKMAGGGTGHGPHDVYPDGWQITARQLFKNGNYNPKGAQILFYQSGAFNCMATDVPTVGKMQRTATVKFG